MNWGNSFFNKTLSIIILTGSGFATANTTPTIEINIKRTNFHLYGSRYPNNRFIVFRFFISNTKYLFLSQFIELIKTFSIMGFSNF